MDILKKIWSGWMAFGRFMGNIVGRVVLSIFYFTILVPFGLGVTFFGDPLAIKTLPNPFWRPRQTGDQILEDALRQY